MLPQKASAIEKKINKTRDQLIVKKKRHICSETLKNHKFENEVAADKFADAVEQKKMFGESR